MKMGRTSYIRFEILRNIRNKKALILSMGFPLVLYLAITGSNRGAHFDGIAFDLYFLAGMSALGTMASVIASGMSVSAERADGWTRQMRITPLKERSYFGAKVLCGYLRAISTIALLCLGGTAFGVRLSAGEWVSMIGLMLVALIPFAVMG